MTTRRRLRRRPLGVLVVTHLVRISYVFAPFSEPVLAPGIIFSPAGRGKNYNPGWGLPLNLLKAGHMAGHKAGHMAGHVAGHVAGHMAGHVAGHMAGHMAGYMADRMAGLMAGNMAGRSKGLEVGVGVLLGPPTPLFRHLWDTLTCKTLASGTVGLFRMLNRNARRASS